jgi:hypothetical protein
VKDSERVGGAPGVPHIGYLAKHVTSALNMIRDDIKEARAVAKKMAAASAEQLARQSQRVTLTCISKPSTRLRQEEGLCFR